MTINQWLCGVVVKDLTSPHRRLRGSEFKSQQSQTLNFLGFLFLFCSFLSCFPFGLFPFILTADPFKRGEVNNMEEGEMA